MSNTPDTAASVADKSAIDEDRIMTFPCDFAVKVMGENSNDYANTVLSICQKHVEGVSRESLHSRLSSSEKYIAVTVQLVAASRRQLDDLYIELNNQQQTKMAL